MTVRKPISKRVLLKPFSMKKAKSSSRRRKKPNATTRSLPNESKQTRKERKHGKRSPHSSQSISSGCSTQNQRKKIEERDFAKSDCVSSLAICAARSRLRNFRAPGIQAHAPRDATKRALLTKGGADEKICLCSARTDHSTSLLFRETHAGGTRRNSRTQASSSRSSGLSCLGKHRSRWRHARLKRSFAR